MARFYPSSSKLANATSGKTMMLNFAPRRFVWRKCFGVTIPHGAVFHAQTKRRREVDFNADLRARTEQAVAELHALYFLGIHPARALC